MDEKIGLQGYIMPDDLFEALPKETQEKVISLSKEMNEGKDPSFENVSSIFTKIKYPVTIVGVKEHVGRFLVSWDGAIVCPPLHISFLDTRINIGPNLLYVSFKVGPDLTPFGGAKDENVSRSLLDGYLPVVTTNYRYDGLLYEETVFGYSEDFSTGNPLIAFIRMKIKNPSGERKDTKLSIWFRETEGHKVVPYEKKLSMEGKKILNEDGSVIYWSEDQGGTFEKDELSYELSLSPNEEKELYFSFPHLPVSGDRLEILSELSFDEALEKVRAFWKKEVIEQGMQVDVPEEMVENAYKTWLINNFLLAQEDKSHQKTRWHKKTEYYEVHDAPFFYESVFGYAASMYLNTITTRGYYKEAKKCVDMFVKLQRPNGMFSGILNEIPHQNGSIIYAICQLYRMSRDAEWFKTVVPNVMDGCNWIIRIRSKSKNLVNGKKTVTYGLLPAYMYCEDRVAITQEYLGNAWCWAGLNQAAITLSELGGEFAEESIRLKKEADEYREDILASMDKAVVEENDLSFLPMVVENRKPYKNLQESILARFYNILAPRMMESEIFDIDDERIHWVPDFLEQRRGLVMGLARIGVIHGGIYAHFVAGYGITNLRLNEIGKFLFTFYGLISYGMARDIYSTQELSSIITGTVRREGAWSDLRQPHLHSTSEMIRLLNMMLIKEERDEVWLAYGVPRKWLEDGKKIEVRKAQTCFGAFNFCITSNVSKGLIETKLSASIGNPPYIIRLKLRHPEGKDITRVEIDGKNWDEFEGEVINIHSLTSFSDKPSDVDISIVAYY